MVEGGVHIDCFTSPDESPRIRINRPVHAARVFEGKTADTTLALVPALFNVCGAAQGVAASHAIAAASGRAHPDDITAAHAALVRAEIAREHLWRILMDWTRFCDRSADAAALSAMQALLPNVRQALFDGLPFCSTPKTVPYRKRLAVALASFDKLLESTVLGVTPDVWLGLETADDLNRYRHEADGIVPALLGVLSAQGWESGCVSATGFLPALDGQALDYALGADNADRFVEHPEWHGQAWETSSLKRQQNASLVRNVVNENGAGMLARVVATVTELAATCGDVTAILSGTTNPGINATRGPSGAGVAQVEAARGLLMHRVLVDDEHVSSYRAVAPTEWNFHPGGAVQNGLSNLRSTASETRAFEADLFVTLVDPCVAHSLEIH